MADSSVRRHSVGEVDRPLSPHIEIWRFTVTMATSILTRVSAFGALFAFLAVLLWIAALASGREAYEAATGLMTSPAGLAVLFLASWAVAFHMIAGVRHILWDFGIGFDLPSARLGSWIIIFGSLALTVTAWATASAIR